MKGRFEDRDLLDTYHEMQCLVCGDTEGVVAHHLLSRKAYGPDKKENLIPLCVSHHHSIHKSGRNTFAKRYPVVSEYMLENGWAYCDIFKRWFPPNFNLFPIQS